jgi:DUF971 family protein
MSGDGDGNGGGDGRRDDVVDIEIQRTEGVTITYADGAQIAVDVGQLRAVCPCAHCRGMRDRGEPVWPPGQRSPLAVHPAIRIVDATLVGAWGLSLDWSDGHGTGIYAWSVLRDWWDAGHDGPLVTDP